MTESTGRLPRYSTAPAEGERRAIRGYGGQYLVAASRILAALRARRLTWIRLADPEAGRVDDAQIGSAHDVNAYQVKWSRYPGLFRFSDLTSSTAAPSLLAQLADGWQRLRAVHTGRRIVVHLVTNDIASSNDVVPGTREMVGSRAGRSFATFLAQCWIPAQAAARAGRDPDTAIPAEWSVIWDTFRQAASLSVIEWGEFVGDCVLEFGATDPRLLSTDETQTLDPELYAWREDLARLSEVLFRLVAHPDAQVHFSREELLFEIGWESRLEFAHRHEFPDPDVPYRAVRETEAALRTAIDHFDSGYLTLLGTPGSGKSTLLTQTLRYRERVVRYYAYVPPSVGRSDRRGEARNFLHDVVLALEEQGIRVGRTLPADDEGRLSARLEVQFAELSREYRMSGHKTVILVDGLDHISREQRPVRSLLAELPLPIAVPPGVLIVLGSQTDQLADLPTPVLSQLDEPGRRLRMQPLTREDVVEIVRGAALDPAPIVDEQDEVFRLSAGHPLALNYMINRLRTDTQTSVAAVLARVAPFQERIDDQYLEHWRQVERDYPLVHLLALLARVRGVIQMEWVAKWAEPPSLYRLTNEFGHYFRRELGGRWSFFHNSFRAFLAERTRANVALPNDEVLYATLADFCAVVPKDDLARADELYYRARAGDHAAVLRLARPELWREQFIAGRPPTGILMDTRDAMASAIANRDVVALTRTVLSNQEFVRRDYYADLLPIGELLVGTGDINAALRWLVDEQVLLVPETFALSAAAALDDAGARDEAREIFGLAEPLELLTNRKPLAFHEQREAFERFDAWIEVAPRFRSPTDLVEVIERLIVPTDPSELRRAAAVAPADAEESNQLDRDPRTDVDEIGGADVERGNTIVDIEASIRLRARLLRRLATVLDSLNRQDEAELVLHRIKPLGDDTWLWWFWGMTNAWQDAIALGDVERARARFTSLHREVTAAPQEHFGPRERVALAEGLIRVLGDVRQAAEIVRALVQPPVIRSLDHTSKSGFNVFVERFTLNRVLGALGDRRALSTVVPDPPFGEPSFIVYFERAVVTVARLAGLRWTGQGVSSATFMLEVFPILRLFVRPPQPQQQLNEGWSVGYGARQELYEILIRTAARHGAEVFEALRTAFEQEWDDPELSVCWPLELKRALVIALADAGVSAEWAAIRLRSLEPTSYSPGDLETELPEAAKQVRAWQAIGNPEASRQTLKAILLASFGVEHKDYQLDAWIEWIHSANKVDHVGAAARIAKMASAVASANGATGHQSAAVTLLEEAAACGPRLATSLFRWYIARGEVPWVAAFNAYLRGTLACVPKSAPYIARVYQHLVMPYERTAEASLCTALANHTENPSAGDIRSTIEELRSVAAVVALGSTRRALYAALDRRRDDARTLRKSYGNDEQRSLDGVQGSRLSAHEWADRLRSVEDVQDFMARITPGAYIPWERVLKDFVAGANVTTLKATASVLPRIESVWRIRMEIAQRLAQFGESDVARTIAESILESSSSSGWHERYDGGSRQKPLTLLLQLNSSETRERAWQILGDDLQAGRVDAFGLVTNWFNIVPLLIDPVPVVQVSEEIEAYVQVLAASFQPPPPPELPAAIAPGESVDIIVIQQLATLTAEYLDHPAYVFAHGAQRAFVDWLLSRDEEIQQVVLMRLKDESSFAGADFLVLQAVADRDPDAVRFLVPVLRARYPSVDARARRRIENLMAILEEELRPLARRIVKLPLPAAYQVLQARSMNDEPLRPSRSEEYLPPALNAADLVKAFSPQVELIARLAGVPYDAVARDVAGRARGLRENPALWDDERPLREQLNSLRVHPTIRRPRMLQVEQAIFEVAADLEDRGALGDEYRDVLSMFLLNSDPTFLVARPVTRPDVVARIEERVISNDHTFHHPKDDWTSQVNSESVAVGSAFSSEDSRIVLAEETWTRWLDWGRATETRAGVRILNTGQQGLDEDEEDEGGDMSSRMGNALNVHCDSWSHVLAKDYLRQKPGNHLIVRQHSIRFETPGDSWLAFNPSLAKHLGWSLNENGLFCWCNALGQVMVESIWWEDGWRGMDPPLWDDEVGEGWLVVASRAAVEQINQVVGPTIDYVRVEREAKNQPNRIVQGIRPERST